MIKRYFAFLAPLILFVVMLVAFAGGHDIASKSWSEKWAKRDTAEARQKQQAADNAIAEQQRRQQSVAALDEKYTRELADAKATIDSLRRDVDSGAKRLRIHATCPGVPGTATATSPANAARPGFDDTLKRNYFTLRERIETAGRQIEGLQQYIKEQCTN